MPNWVFNQLHVHGTPDEIAKFKADLSRPIVVSVGEVADTVFSYMNVISPWDQGISESEYFATHGSGPNGMTGNTDGNWYNWNRQYWGVKWDCDAELDNDEATYVSYRFDSPWGPPTEVIDAIAAKYPTMTFSHNYEEEQGWGGEVEYANGVGTVTDMYDIPECHADYVARGQEYSCACAWGEPEDFYDDCPPYVEGEAPRG